MTVAIAAPQVCARCLDPLPDDAPPGLLTCREYADWVARTKGDQLTADRADALQLFWLMCGLDEALREGGKRFGRMRDTGGTGSYPKPTALSNKGRVAGPASGSDVRSRSFPHPLRLVARGGWHPHVTNSVFRPGHPSLDR